LLQSAAAAGLCAWAINIVKFYEIYCDVEPKRIALAKANSDLAAAQEKLAGIKAKINVSFFNSQRSWSALCVLVYHVLSVSFYSYNVKVVKFFLGISVAGAKGCVVHMETRMHAFSPLILSVNRCGQLRV